MNSLHAKKVNIDGLKSVYSNLPAAQAFLGICARCKEDANETSVDGALDLLAQSGKHFSRAELIEMFRGLQSVRCGKFRTGRRGWPSRFEWHTGLVSVGRLVTGDSTEVEVDSEDKRDDVEESLLFQHTFRLRPDLEVGIELPFDLTQHEATRLGDFIRTLPFSSNT